MSSYGSSAPSFSQIQSNQICLIKSASTVTKQVKRRVVLPFQMPYLLLTSMFQLPNTLYVYLNISIYHCVWVQVSDWIIPSWKSSRFRFSQTSSRQWLLSVLFYLVYWLPCTCFYKLFRNVTNYIDWGLCNIATFKLPGFSFHSYNRIGLNVQIYTDRLSECERFSFSAVAFATSPVSAIFIIKNVSRITVMCLIMLYTESDRLQR